MYSVNFCLEWSRRKSSIVKQGQKQLRAPDFYLMKLRLFGIRILICDLNEARIGKIKSKNTVE